MLPVHLNDILSKGLSSRSVQNKCDACIAVGKDLLFYTHGSKAKPMLFKVQKVLRARNRWHGRFGPHKFAQVTRTCWGYLMTASFLQIATKLKDWQTKETHKL
jgi:hypothetical protein